MKKKGVSKKNGVLKKKTRPSKSLSEDSPLDDRLVSSSLDLTLVSLYSIATISR